MSTWSTVRELCADLNLNSASYDLKSVNEELKKLRAALHPDLTGGQFKSKADEDRYHRLNDALNFLIDNKTSALVPIEGIKEIVTAVVQTLQKPTESDVAQERVRYKRSALSEIRGRLLLPRIGSGSFAALSGALTTFSSTLKQNPVFAPFLDSPAGIPILQVIFLVSIALFGLSWWLEQRERSFIDWLNTEEGLHAVTGDVVSNAWYRIDKDEQLDSNNAIPIYFMDYCNAILNQEGNRLPIALSVLVHPLSPSREVVSRQGAEKLARVHLKELEARGVVTKVDKPGIDIAYEMDRDSVEQVRKSSSKTFRKQRRLGRRWRFGKRRRV